jgi:hypothetical protein
LLLAFYCLLLFFRLYYWFACFLHNFQYNAFEVSKKKKKKKSESESQFMTSATCMKYTKDHPPRPNIHAALHVYDYQAHLISPGSREGVRKSTREHFKPLKWWRGERYVYGREKGSGSVFVPIKEIMRIPKEAPVYLRKRSMRGRNKGWGDNTADNCMILEYPGGTERLRRAVNQP